MSVVIRKAQGAELVAFEDSPLRGFHVWIAVAGSGGQFSDGFVLGIVGSTIETVALRLHLTPVWVGALAAASLAGLFFGALLAGPIADRIGRRPIFGWDMLAFAVLSASQWLVTSIEQLLLLRLLLGVTLGADYVASKALVTEYCPQHFRGRLLSVLGIAWTTGYACASCVGFALRHFGTDPWRWMLLSSALPAAVIFPLRLSIPESPLWLMHQGKTREAAQIVARKFGRHLAPPSANPSVRARGFPWRSLFSPRWRSRTLIACLFYVCQVTPFFAIGTFFPRVLAVLRVQDGDLGGLVYACFLLGGGLVGLLIADRIPRRVFLVSTFYASALVLAALTSWPDGSASVTLGFFALFSIILSAATNLEYVYTPELFPTELRASGVGLAVAFSRLGAAAGTFLLPVVMHSLGVRAALVACIVVLILGGVGCQLWAPETGKAPLAAAEGADKRPLT